jgi:hypothetical protein
MWSAGYRLVARRITILCASVTQPASASWELMPGWHHCAVWSAQFCQQPAEGKIVHPEHTYGGPPGRCCCTLL